MYKLKETGAYSVITSLAEDEKTSICYQSKIWSNFYGWDDKNNLAVQTGILTTDRCWSTARTTTHLQLPYPDPGKMTCFFCICLHLPSYPEIHVFFFDVKMRRIEISQHARISYCDLLLFEGLQ